MLLAGAASAQLPRSFYAWWNSPVAKDLGLSASQRREIRDTVRDYRPRLLELRTEVQEAETELENQFNQQPVDLNKASDSIEKLASARADLTRTLSQMSLRLRAIVTQEQWQELQRRRPNAPTKAQAAPEQK